MAKLITIPNITPAFFNKRDNIGVRGVVVIICLSYLIIFLILVFFAISFFLKCMICLCLLYLAYIAHQIFLSLSFGSLSWLQEEWGVCMLDSRGAISPWALFCHS